MYVCMYVCLYLIIFVGSHPEYRLRLKQLEQQKDDITKMTGESHVQRFFEVYIDKA